jgi:hypothetical protein
MNTQTMQYPGLPLDDLPRQAIGPLKRPSQQPMEQPMLKYYRSCFVMANLKDGAISLVGQVGFETKPLAEAAARERGECLGVPVLYLGCVDPRKVTGSDCIVVFERKVLNGMTEVYE